MSQQIRLKHQHQQLCIHKTAQTNCPHKQSACMKPHVHSVAPSHFYTKTIQRSTVTGSSRRQHKTMIPGCARERGGRVLDLALPLLFRIEI